VRAVGELHNVIHPELPRPFNSGYLVTAGAETVYHPGDALEPPGERVDVLFCPASAPWLRSEMAIDFVRAVGAPRNLAIHDRVYSEAGHRLLAAQMDQLVEPRGQSWLRVEDGADL
jgi:L-ascorbate metabolism protein UlaG (beta-lactamase superfamily)